MKNPINATETAEIGTEGTNLSSDHPCLPHGTESDVSYPTSLMKPREQEELLDMITRIAWEEKSKDRVGRKNPWNKE
jgi:hypothetical protein